MPENGRAALKSSVSAVIGQRDERFCDESPLPDSAAAELLDGASSTIRVALSTSRAGHAVDDAPLPARTLSLLDAAVFAAPTTDMSLIDEMSRTLPSQASLPLVDVQDQAEPCFATVALRRERCRSTQELALHWRSRRFPESLVTTSMRAHSRIAGIAGDLALAERQPVEDEAVQTRPLSSARRPPAGEPHRSFAAQVSQDGGGSSERDQLLDPSGQVLLQQSGDDALTISCSNPAGPDGERPTSCPKASSLNVSCTGMARVRMR